MAQARPEAGKERQLHDQIRRPIVAVSEFGNLPGEPRELAVGVVEDRCHDPAGGADVGPDACRGCIERRRHQAGRERHGRDVVRVHPRVAERQDRRAGQAAVPGLGGHRVAASGLAPSSRAGGLAAIASPPGVSSRSARLTSRQARHTERPSAARSFAVSSSCWRRRDACCGARRLPRLPSAPPGAPMSRPQSRHVQHQHRPGFRGGVAQRQPRIVG